MSEAIEKAKQSVREGIAVLVIAVDTDDEFWKQYPLRQLHEQVMDSGYLLGYRDALESVMRLLDGDPDPLSIWIASVRTQITERRKDMREDTQATGP